MLQVTSNYSKIFANCGVDLYTGNTFNDAISCLKMRIDLYTGSPYTRVYTVCELVSLLYNVLFCIGSNSMCCVRGPTSIEHRALLFF